MITVQPVACVYLFRIVAYSAPNGVVNGVVNLRFLTLFAAMFVG